MADKITAGIVTAVPDRIPVRPDLFRCRCGEPEHHAAMMLGYRRFDRIPVRRDAEPRPQQSAEHGQEESQQNDR